MRLLDTGARHTLARVLAVACIVAALLVWWHRRKAIAVVIAADLDAVTAGGSTRLEATVLRKRDRSKLDVAQCKFSWSTAAGSIAGSGASVEWKAPTDPTASVRVSVRAECDDREAKSRISLAAEEPKVPVGGFAGGNNRDPSAVTVRIPAVTTKPEQRHEGRGDAPIIDEIVVEKTQLCKGEDNLITVKSHDPKGTDDAWIHTVIDGNLGASLPLNYVTSTTKRMISVASKDGLSITFAEVPHVTVLDCVTPYIVEVGYSLVPNTEDMFHFEIRVTPKGGARPFEVCSYEWDFGDETGLSTQTKWTDHSYLERPQVGLESTFLIKAKLLPCDGSGSISGRTALNLRNMYAAQKEFKKISGLIIIPDPRYPERGPDDVVRQNARIRTFEQDPVRVTKITYRDTIPSVGPDPQEAVDVSVSSFLGRETVGREWITVAVSFDMKQNPSWIMRQYTFEGKTSAGERVYGSYTLMAPPKLDRETSEKVLDPEMKERIQTAMRLLNKKQVTDEDMLDLQRQGKLPWKDPTDRKPAVPPPGFVQPNTPAIAPPKPEPPAPPPAASGGGGPSKPR